MRRTFGALNAREKEFVVALTVTGTVNQVKNAFQEQSKWQRSSRLIKAIRVAEKNVSLYSIQREDIFMHRQHGLNRTARLPSRPMLRDHLPWLNLHVRCWLSV
jgi:hypothetical protein